MANENELLVVTAESRLIAKGRLTKRIRSGSYGCRTKHVQRVVDTCADEDLDSLFWKLLNASYYIERTHLKRIVTRKASPNANAYGPRQLIFDESAKKLFKQVCAEWDGCRGIMPLDTRE